MSAPPPATERARPALLIVHLEPVSGRKLGDDVYRTIQPCRALGELDHVSVVSGSLLTPALTTVDWRDDILNRPEQQLTRPGVLEHGHGAAHQRDPVSLDQRRRSCEQRAISPAANRFSSPAAPDVTGRMAGARYR